MRNLLCPLWVCDGDSTGVYGGQVVSQAIVAATRTVDQAFHLHVSALFAASAILVFTKLDIKSLHVGLIRFSFPIRLDKYICNSAILC